MTPDAFRKMALSYPNAIESSHMAHPDFRINGTIFATLGYPDEKRGMVKLTPEQQRMFVEQAPDVFSPCNGAWGQRGATNVHLPSAKSPLIRAALECAFQNASVKTPGKKRVKP
jgi:hypothetical protein